MRNSPGATRFNVSALERCAGDPELFAREVWGRRTLVHRTRAARDAVDETRPAAPAAGFADLLTLDAVDHLLSSTALRTPAFRLVRDGSPLPAAGYTKTSSISSVPMTGLADPVRIFREFDAGATIVLQGAHRFSPPIARFCRELELELGHPCQANAYITPPGSKGLALHEDSHDVFVLQAFGRKHWQVRETPAERAAGGREPIDRTLEPGDVLYLPKGTPHAARTQEELSGHLTIGIQATTWRSLVDDVARRLKREASLGLDERLPAGYHRDRGALAPAMRDRLADLARYVDKLDAAELADDSVDRFLTTRSPLVRGQLVDGSRVHEVADATLLRRREATLCELRPRGERLDVLLGDRRLRMPSWVEPAMRALAALPAGGGIRGRDLEADLDAESRVVLLRRLVREGYLEIASDLGGSSGEHAGDGLTSRDGSR
jgi:bifunctional lysine-specific demethylase and histidyl-hydroxylase NO66